MKSILFCAAGSPTNNTTSYQALATSYFAGLGLWTGDDFYNYQRIVPAGTLRNLKVQTRVNPGTSTLVITLQVGGVDTDLTLTATGSTNEFSNEADEVAISAGDLVRYKCVKTGTGGSIIRITVEFESTTPNEFPLSVINTHTVNSDSNLPVFGKIARAATTTNVSQLCPTAGTIKNLYFDTQVAFGGNSKVCTLYKNGSPTSLTCTITGGGVTSATDLVNEVAVAAGDLLHWFVDDTGGTAAYYRISAVFESDTEDEFPLIAGTNDASNDGEYNAITGNDQFSATELNFTQIGVGGLKIKNLHYAMITAPGAGETRTVTLRKDEVNTALTVTVADTNLANSATSEVSFSDYELLSLVFNKSASAVASGGEKWGMAATLGGAGGGLYKNLLLMGVG